MPDSPGYGRQSTIRGVFRTLGIVLSVAGAGLVAFGFHAFANQDPASTDGPGAGFFMFAVGGFVLVAGAWMLNAGFGGLAARYAAGEVMPVVKDSLEFLEDKGGPFCAECGARQDEGARFCTACGTKV